MATITVYDTATNTVHTETVPMSVVGWDDFRRRRQTYLEQTDWVIARHGEQTLAGVPTTLADTDFNALASLRQTLRDAPASDLTPEQAIALIP